jgi:hypothetical protein
MLFQGFCFANILEIIGNGSLSCNDTSTSPLASSAQGYFVCSPILNSSSYFLIPVSRNNENLTFRSLGYLILSI